MMEDKSKPDEKIKAPSYKQKVAYDMSDLYLNTASVLHCEHCHECMGVLHTLRSALFKKQGVAYIVVCKACKHPNVRVKGLYKQKTEEQWKRYQDELGKQP